MTPLSPELIRIQAALHPLDAVPTGPSWNTEELAGLPRSAESVIAAAVLVGLVPRHDGLQVLFTLRTGDLRLHAGQVSFPGGRIEPDDVDACAAAIRETTEEVGIQPAQIQPLGYLDPLATITGFRVVPLVAVVTPDYIPRHDPREVDDVFEIPFDFLMAPVNLKQISIEFRGCPRSVLEFVDSDGSGRRIWGASASILLNLRHRLETAQ